MNLSQSKTRLHEWVVTGVFCAFFFFYGLAAFGVVGADEPRYAQIAREMLARHDWVSPTLHGRVWLEKPIPYYWSAMASYRLFGVSDCTARIPVALFASVLVFLLTALPWYVLVQLRNPQFFKEFILRQNLARFGTNLYHHEEPFWYYLPVLLVGLFPWTVFSLAAWARVVPAFFRKSTGVKAEPTADDLQKFLAVWAVLPVVFFSLSQSKLPGYILPAIPAWVLLTILYFVRESTSGRRNYSLWIAHALTVAAAGAMILLAPTILLAPHQLHSLSLWKAPLLVAVILAGILTALAFCRGWQAIYVST